MDPEETLNDLSCGHISVNIIHPSISPDAEELRHGLVLLRQDRRMVVESDPEDRFPRFRHYKSTLFDLSERPKNASCDRFTLFAGRCL